MAFTLLPLSRLQLQALAAAQEPAGLMAQAEPESLPPAFVAARTLELAGGPDDSRNVGPWSTTFLIVRSIDGRFVGACGFKSMPRAGRVEVGYGVSPTARGQGAATAALNLLVGLAFEADASEVLAEILPENPASTRVAQKAGFVRVGQRVDEDGEAVGQWLRRNDVG